MRRLGHHFKAQEFDRYRERTVLKPEGTGHVGEPKMKYLDSVEEDLKKKGVRNWRRKSQDREQCKMILEEAEVHQEL
jgi:hypothetical protein